MIDTELIQRAAKFTALVAALPAEGLIDAAMVKEVAEAAGEVLLYASTMNEALRQSAYKVITENRGLKAEIQRLKRENAELTLLAQAPAVGTFHA